MANQAPLPGLKVSFPAFSAGIGPPHGKRPGKVGNRTRLNTLLTIGIEAERTNEVFLPVIESPRSRQSPGAFV